ncbi:mariner Mos1 transposase [Trichonephila clavipes]|nr:mariner Mos1 transposase [Trichonephila clavipes]
MCSSHPIRHNVEPFFDKLITGDEKWIPYENIKRKKSYCKPVTVPKPSIHERKVLLFVVEQERSSVLQVAETEKNHQRGSVLQSAG